METEKVTIAAPSRNGATEEWLSSQRACAALGVAERTLRKWAAKGRLHREFGHDGRPRYRRVEVQRLAAEIGAELPPPAPIRDSPNGKKPPRRSTSKPRTPRALPAGGAASRDLADARTREQHLLAENAWLRECLQRTQKAEEDLRAILLGIHQAEHDFRVLLLQIHHSLQALGAPGLLPEAPAPRARRARLRPQSPGDTAATSSHS
jgi:Helix-turn-helix domain